jgi:hypothetical protein
VVLLNVEVRGIFFTFWPWRYSFRKYVFKGRWLTPIILARSCFKASPRQIVLETDILKISNTKGLVE